MNVSLRLVLVLVCWVACTTSMFAEEEGFRPLFNGKNLDGWVRVNTAQSTWSVRDGMLICSGKPIGELRTTRMYQNFILELEWRHMKPKGNAGVFVWADDITARGVPFHRSIEVQVLENAYGNTRSHTTHGDIFPIHGATMTPINGRGGSRAFPAELRSNPSPEWNHYRIECRDGDISLAVNGKVVTRGKEASPRNGYICLESEGGIVHYKNIRIKGLPDTPIDKEHIAIADRGFRCLYNGIDLENWQVSGGGWKPNDWVLAYDGGEEGSIMSAGELADIHGFVVDVRMRKQPGTVSIQIGEGDSLATFKIDPEVEAISKYLAKPGEWNRLEGVFKGDSRIIRLNGEPVMTFETGSRQTDGPLRITTSAPVDLANIYIRERPVGENSAPDASTPQ